MLHLYYGLGKGKSSALNGSSLRAKGANLKVGFFKFLKGRISSEDTILAKVVDNFKRVQTSEKFVIFMNEQEKKQTKKETLAVLEYILAKQNDYDVIILDEFLDLSDKTVDFLTPQEQTTFLKKLKTKEVLVSGHHLPKEIEQIADLITFYQAKKHYYVQGIKARKGIEY